MDSVVYQYLGGFMRDVVMPTMCDEKRASLVPVSFTSDRYINGLGTFETV